MPTMDRNVYAFTNENLSSFENLYPFNGAKVLSIIGSGDQYFASLLYGAKEIVLYDSNPNTWEYFVFKFYALMLLSYEDFLELAVMTKYSSERLLNIVFKYLPSDVASRLLNLAKMNGGLSESIIYSALSDWPINYESNRIIPYLDKKRYYILQNKLRATKLPRHYICDFLDLHQLLRQENFDILLNSNILNWLWLSPSEYQRFLAKWKVDIVQANYIWNCENKCLEEFANLGFDIDSVPPVTIENSNLHNEENYVISKR